MDGRSAGPGVAADVDQPVFVDRTGQRRRLTVLAGASIAVGLLVSLGLIIAGLFGGSPVPLPGWPDGGVQQQGTEPLDTIVPSPTPAPPTELENTPPSQGGPSATQPSTQTTTDKPGVGDPTRTPPGHRPSKSPGKPR